MGLHKAHNVLLLLGCVAGLLGGCVVGAIAPFKDHRAFLRPQVRPPAAYTDGAEADRVTRLPGAPPLDFGLFSGYVTVDKSAGRALFYIFAEARSGAADAPLLLWLNGGPGCSSIGGGFMSELGPFYPNKDGKSLQVNPYAWNDMANVLWLESPAFVGFSYSNTSADAIVGDARTAADARMFLLGWLRRFPQYAHSDFYISGESYAGHYVPNLAWEIVQGNRRAEQEAAAATAASSSSSSSVGVVPGRGHINLKGFFVGNAWTDPAIDNKGALDFWYTHAMIGEESYRAVHENCDFNVIGPLMRGSQAVTLPGTHSTSDLARMPPDNSGSPIRPGAAAAAADPSIQLLQLQQQRQLSSKVDQNGEIPHNPDAGGVEASGLGHSRVEGWSGWGSSATTQYWGSRGGPEFSHHDKRDAICAKWLDIAFAEQGNINIYEIYADVCSKRANRAARKYYGALLGFSKPADLQGAAGDPDFDDDDDDDADGGQPRRPRYDPCVDGEVETYLNLPEVQEALHANQSVKLPWRWTDCTSLISYSREDLLSSMLPTYRNLLSTGLKIWVFSGDVDGIVPVLGSRRWVASLGLPTVKPWRPWVSSTGQVGGWRVDYENLTFATVRNAGHMVPYVQPERAYYLLSQFLFGDEPQPSR